MPAALKRPTISLTHSIISKTKNKLCVMLQDGLAIGSTRAAKPICPQNASPGGYPHQHPGAAIYDGFGHVLFGSFRDRSAYLRCAAERHDTPSQCLAYIEVER